MKLSNKNVFFVDAAGALISFALLGFILPWNQKSFGMPFDALYLLASIALTLLIYSTICAFRVKRNKHYFLRLIIFCNSAYCILTIALIVRYFSKLTSMGLAYFVGEILVLYLLISQEIKVLKKGFKKESTE